MNNASEYPGVNGGVVIHGRNEGGVEKFWRLERSEMNTGKAWAWAVLIITVSVLSVDLYCGLTFGVAATLSDHVRDWSAHWPVIKWLYCGVFGFLFYHFFIQRNQHGIAHPQHRRAR